MASRASIPKDETNPHYIRFKRESARLIRFAFLNNKHLLKRTGITLAKQIKDFEQKGIYLSRSSIGGYLRYSDDKPFNPRLDIKTSFLCMIAHYWGKTLWEFISVDYSLQDIQALPGPGTLPDDNQDALKEFI